MQKLSIERLIKGKFSRRPKTKVITPRMVKSPVHKFLYNYKASNENPCGQLFFEGIVYPGVRWKQVAKVHNGL